MPQVKPYLRRSVSLHRAQCGRISDSGVCLIKEGFLDTCPERGLLEGTVNWYRNGLKRFYQNLQVKNVSIRCMTKDFKDIGLKKYVMRMLKSGCHVRGIYDYI